MGRVFRNVLTCLGLALFVAHVAQVHSHPGERVPGSAAGDCTACPVHSGAAQAPAPAVAIEVPAPVRAAPTDESALRLACALLPTGTNPRAPPA